MPALQKNKNVIISAHGNSLRALVKFIEEISEEEIVKLEICLLYTSPSPRDRG